MVYPVYYFDAYGTLFDVHSAVRKHAAAIGPDAAQLSDIWRAKQLEYSWVLGLMGAYRDFWELTQEALDFAFAKVPSADFRLRQNLLDAYWELEAYPEVLSTLSALKEAGAITGILSNGSSDMLNAAIKSSGISDVLDAAISVDRLSRFKTDPRVYQMVLDDHGMEAHQISFQSSNRWDVAAAQNFGFRTVWINRTGQPDEYLQFAPDYLLSDLRGLTVV